MKLKRKITTLRIVAILILAVVGFHSSGIETAFCESSVDVATSKALPDSHGCLNCQPDHHTAIQNDSLDIVQTPSVDFISADLHFFAVKDISFTFFRPPIFA